MKQLLVALVLMSFVPAAFVAVFNDDMSSLAAWGQASSSTVEYNAGDGGIYLIDDDDDTFSDAVQYNSWTVDSLDITAGWTDSWADTGLLVADETDYTLTVTMKSFVGGGQAVPFSLQGNWVSIVSGSPVVSDAGWADYSISFSTTGVANDGLIGQALGIGISPGWWNNLAVDNVSVTVPEPMTMALLGLGSLALRRRKR